MNSENPYMNQGYHKKNQSKAPLIFRLPIHDFEDARDLENSLLPFECCVARIRNPRPTGFTHDVAIVYKDDLDRVYSLQMYQHHGELKDTLENRKLLDGEADEPTGKTGQTSPTEGVREEVEGSQGKEKI